MYPVGVSGVIRISKKRLLAQSEIALRIQNQPLYYMPLFGDKIFTRAIQKNLSWQFWSKEFMEAFAAYLRARIRDPRIPVLDAGAGNGLLTYWLNHLGIKTVGIDDRNKNRASYMRYAESVVPDFVERMDYRDALKKFSPELVICSWMPSGESWDRDLRQTKSVKEYIIIGMPGATGDKWFDPAGNRSSSFRQVVLSDLCDVSLSISNFYAHIKNSAANVGPIPRAYTPPDKEKNPYWRSMVVSYRRR